MPSKETISGHTAKTWIYKCSSYESAGKFIISPFFALFLERMVFSWFWRWWSASHIGTKREKECEPIFFNIHPQHTRIMHYVALTSTKRRELFQTKSYAIVWKTSSRTHNVNDKNCHNSNEWTTINTWGSLCIEFTPTLKICVSLCFCLCMSVVDGVFSLLVACLLSVCQ